MINLHAESPFLGIVTEKAKPVTKILFDRSGFEETIGQKLNRVVKVQYEVRKKKNRYENHAVDVSLVSDEMPWESVARIAIESALREAQFDADARVVSIPAEDARGERTMQEFETLEELREELSERATNEWYAAVPFDSGVAVFDLSKFDLESLLDRALEEHRGQLIQLGWLSP